MSLLNNSLLRERRVAIITVLIRGARNKGLNKAAEQGKDFVLGLSGTTRVLGFGQVGLMTFEQA